MLPKGNRLRRPAEFELAVRQGRRASSPTLVVHALVTSDAADSSTSAAADSRAEPGEERVRESVSPGSPQMAPRVGIVVSRAVGTAVQRNRVKRVLRESFWEVAGDLPTDHDFVLVARRDMAELIEREGASGAKRCIGELVEERST